MRSSQGFAQGFQPGRGPGWGLLCNSTANGVSMVFCLGNASKCAIYKSINCSVDLQLCVCMAHLKAATKTVKTDVPKDQELGWKSWGDNKSQSLYENTK